MTAESVRFQILRMATAIKDEPWDSPAVQLVTGHVMALSWLDRGLAELSLLALAKALRERDMAQVSACLNELCAGLEAA